MAAIRAARQAARGGNGDMSAPRAMSGAMSGDPQPAPPPQ
jgi:hypothetical protein